MRLRDTFTPGPILGCAFLAFIFYVAYSFGSTALL